MSMDRADAIEEMRVAIGIVAFMGTAITAICERSPGRKPEFHLNDVQTCGMQQVLFFAEAKMDAIYEYLEAGPLEEK